MSMETCRIVTCSSYFKTQTTDGVVLVFSYYLPNNHHYFEFTFSLYFKICHIKTFRFSHQKKCLQRNYKTIKAMCKKDPRHCQYSLHPTRDLLIGYISLHKSIEFESSQWIWVVETKNSFKFNCFRSKTYADYTKDKGQVNIKYIIRGN